MSDKRTCPVCERPGVPAESESCPQCDADLTCFQALKTLAENKAAVSETISTAEKEGAGTRRAVLLLLLLLVLIAALFSLYILKAQEHASALTQQVASLKTDLQKAEQEKQMLCVLPEAERMGAREEESFEEDDPLIYAEDLAAEASSGKETSGEQDGKARNEERQEGQVAGSAPAENERAEKGEDRVEEAEKAIEPPDVEKTASKVPVVEAVAKKERPIHLMQITEEPTLLPPEEHWSGKTFLYLVKETDTLWDVAERFYGDGKYYPVIMEQNPGLIISDIQDEESIRLITDRAMLKDMYSQRIEWRDGMMLWKHTVRPGETRLAIEKRFAPPGSVGRVLYQKNPFIQPGAIVRVILQ
jgi:hypothetical protein